MSRFRWIGRLFVNANYPCVRKATKPSVKPRLETLEGRELLSANPLVDSGSRSDSGSMMTAHGAVYAQSKVIIHDIAALANILLGQAIEQADNRLGQSLGAAHGVFDTLLRDTDNWLNDVAMQLGLGISQPTLLANSNANAPLTLAMNDATEPRVQPTRAKNSLTPGGDPPIQFVEGTSSGQVVGTFTDSDGNTDPSKYTASIAWGNGQKTAGMISYSNGQFQIHGVMTYAEEGSYPITTTVTDQDGDITTVNASAAVSDAPLTTGATYGITATAGQQFNGQFFYFSDANSTAPTSDFTTAIDWGDGQISTGDVVATGNGYFTVGGSHTYALPGGYGVNVVISDTGGSETSSSTTANVSASTSAPAAYDDSYSVIHDNTLTVPAASGVLANDTDPNNLPLSSILVSNAAHGTLNLNSNGSFTYTPNAGYTGGDSFTYDASNGQYTSNTATVSLTVLSTISGQVWQDSNQDGIEDNGETGMSGVTVNLVIPNGSQVTSTTTDANGNYQLSVDPSLGNQFQIQVAIPNGDSATIPFASSSGIVSSIDAAGYSNLLTLPTSGGISNVNAGIAVGAGPLASLSGEVWLDSNDNGTLDSGEPGLQAINVNLLNGNCVVVDSTSTDANGDYSFIGLTPNTPYTVQFIAPNGYVFSPQNVGSPSISSSAGVNGSTAPITLTPGQNDTTVNAGLYGSAPIVYQTNVPMDAENDSYTGMDFTADGYDPGGAPLTPVIVQGPMHGSLVYNSSTGLYDYTAASNYTGLDSFQFQLSDGHAVSAVVTVQILAYGSTIPLGIYDSFPLVDDALFVGNGGNPDPSSVKHGSLNDCWLIAAAAGAAQQSPTWIKNAITDNGNGTFRVTFPTHYAVTIGFAGDTAGYSTANGDWLKVVEKGYGTVSWNEQPAWPRTNKPIDYLEGGNVIDAGIELLTGHKTTYNSLPLTSIDTLSKYLAAAFARNKIVVAGVPGGTAGKKMEAKGLVAEHAYTVVAYDATGAGRVRLRNPWGKNPTFDNGRDDQFWLGKNDPDNPNPNTLPEGGNGYFWMSLSDFKSLFGDIAYEN